MLVAGWPPVALLLAVELLAHRSRSPRAETAPAASTVEPAAPVAPAETTRSAETQRESGEQSGRVLTLAEVSPRTEREGEPTAQEIMWARYLKEQAHGRTPTGAELDRVAGTNNYGRTVLRQWREHGRIPSANGTLQRPSGGVV